MAQRAQTGDGFLHTRTHCPGVLTCARRRGRRNGRWGRRRGWRGAQRLPLQRDLVGGGRNAERASVSANIPPTYRPLSG